MSCASCRDIERQDGVAPMCRENACTIPQAGDYGARALHLRTMLLRLSGIAGPDTVLRAMGASRRDLEMLALIEDALKERKHE